MIIDKNNLDALYETLEVKVSGELKEYSINIFKWLTEPLKRLKKKIRGIFIKELNLDNLTIAGLFSASNAKTPTEVVKIVLDDLGLEEPCSRDYTKVFLSIDSQLKKIGELFKNTNINESEGQSSFAKASQLVPIDAFPSLIDQVAQRMKCSWQDACKLKWSEVYLMLMIDKKNYIFQKDYNKKIEQKYKK